MSRRLILRRHSQSRERLMNGGLILLLVVSAFAAGGFDEPLHALNDQSSPEDFDPEPVVALLELVIEADTDTARNCLAALNEKIRSGELAGPSLASLRKSLAPLLKEVLNEGGKHALFWDAAQTACAWKDPQGVTAMRQAVRQDKLPPPKRIAAFQSLVVAQDPLVLEAAKVLLDPLASHPLAVRAGVLAALGRAPQIEVGQYVLSVYPQLHDELKPKAVELLTQRPAWSKLLLKEISRKRIPAEVLNVNQVRRLLAGRDEQIKAMVAQQWGSLRLDRNPQREQVIVQMNDMLQKTPGDSERGRAVFRRVCGQCHKMYGEGENVGPDLTANGRSSYVQVLSNVFDPSLVIGAAYQARVVITRDGRVLTGLMTEDNEQRIVLKTQGGKTEIVPRGQVDELMVSKLSLMPEGLEKQLKPQEIADLFAYLLLDRPPEDRNAKWIPGVPKGLMKKQLSSAR